MDDYYKKLRPTPTGFGGITPPGCLRRICLVARARNAEYYTAPESYWIDLK